MLKSLAQSVPHQRMYYITLFLLHSLLIETTFNWALKLQHVRYNNILKQTI